MSRTYQEQVAECVRFIAPRLTAPPEWGIILGTGQGDWAARLEGGSGLAYRELPHFPPATSPSHAGRLSWGHLSGKPVMLCQGRFHAYEGYLPPVPVLPPLTEIHRKLDSLIERIYLPLGCCS